MEKKVVVEINKPSTPEAESPSLPRADDERRRRPKRPGTKRDAGDDLDAIRTIKGVEEEMPEEAEAFANGSRAAGEDDEDRKKDECHHKGFSFQRAWCCLRNRRTS